MKRILFITLLVLAIAASLLAGTLAYYTTSVEVASGSVVAKEFIFVAEGRENSFEKGVKIAPSETVTWEFSVKNYDTNVVTETDLYYKLTFDVLAAEGKSAIEPLIVRVKDTADGVLATRTGPGTFDLYGEFLLNESDQAQGYVVELEWPAGGNSDSDYAGSDYGTTIKVSAIAQQLPFDGQTEPGEPEPEEPEPDEPSGIHVEYKTVAHTSNGNDFHYYITIENNTEEIIKNWKMEFSLLSDTLEAVWTGPRWEDLGAGRYRIYHAQYNKINIESGESLSFEGIGTGSGTEAIENVLVNGQSVELTCDLKDN